MLDLQPPRHTPTCMGRLVSRLVLDHPISWFDREATISSSRPNLRSGRQGWPTAIAERRALDGHERSDRLVGSSKPVLRTGFCDDTEGSSPSGANFAPQTCIRLILEDRNHDAVVRIGGEAPRRRAHSKPRLEGHVQYRVAATSARHLRLGLDRRANRRTSVVLAYRQVITPSAEGADLPAPRRWSPAAKVQ
jgi:hypothetical protein